MSILRGGSSLRGASVLAALVIVAILGVIVALMSLLNPERVPIETPSQSQGAAVAVATKIKSFDEVEVAGVSQNSVLAVACPSVIPAGCRCVNTLSGEQLECTRAPISCPIPKPSANCDCNGATGQWDCGLAQDLAPIPGFDYLINYKGEGRPDVMYWPVCPANGLLVRNNQGKTFYGDRSSGALTGVVPVGFGTGPKPIAKNTFRPYNWGNGDAWGGVSATGGNPAVLGNARCKELPTESAGLMKLVPADGPWVTDTLACEYKDQTREYFKTKENIATFLPEDAPQPGKCQDKGRRNDSAGPVISTTATAIPMPILTPMPAEPTPQVPTDQFNSVLTNYLDVTHTVCEGPEKEQCEREVNTEATNYEAELRRLGDADRELVRRCGTSEPPTGCPGEDEIDAARYRLGQLDDAGLFGSCDSPANAYDERCRAEYREYCGKSDIEEAYKEICGKYQACLPPKQIQDDGSCRGAQQGPCPDGRPVDANTGLCRPAARRTECPPGMPAEQCARLRDRTAGPPGQRDPSAGPPSTFGPGASQCTPGYVCQGNTLFYRGQNQMGSQTQCSMMPVQQCQYGCAGLGGAAATGQNNTFQQIGMAMQLISTVSRMFGGNNGLGTNGTAQSSSCAPQPQQQQPGQGQNPNGTGTNGQPCQTPPPRPPDSSCTSGQWQSTSQTGNGCVTGWQCVPNQSTAAGSPKATLSCQPKIADIGMSISLTWACDNADGITSDGFTTDGAMTGTKTVKLQPATAVSYMTFGLICKNGKTGQTSGAQCKVDLVKPSIVLMSNPKVVSSGESSAIGWITSGMQSCRIFNEDFKDWSKEQENNTNTNGAVQSPPIKKDTLFILNCVSLGGETKEATVPVLLKK